MPTIYNATSTVSEDVLAGSDFNRTLKDLTPPSAVLHTKNNVSGGTTDLRTHTYTTPDNVPGLTEWPAGDYIARVDVTTLGADVSFKIAVVRRDSAGALVETLGTSGVFSTVGYKAFTVNLATAKAVAAGDRLGVDLLVSRAASHGNQPFEVRIGQSGSLTQLETPIGPETVTITVLDSGAGSETVAPQVTVSVAESGAGSEIATLEATVGVGDSGAGADVLALEVNPSVLESALGSETVTVTEQVTVTVLEAGTGAETVVVTQEVQILASEAALGAESVALTVTVAAVETALGSDAVAVPQVEVAVADAAAGSEVARLDVVLGVVDGGAGSEALTLTIQVAVLETGIGGETVSWVEDVPLTKYGFSRGYVRRGPGKVRGGGPAE